MTEQHYCRGCHGYISIEVGDDEAKRQVTRAAALSVHMRKAHPKRVGAHS